MSSAQYISVGIFYLYLVQRRREAGRVVRLHPSAHTIISAWVPILGYYGPDSDTSNQHLTSILTQTRSTLRRLVIENVRFRPQELTNPLNDWSTLTHLSMSTLFIHLDTWFAFIRSLSALKSGSFHMCFEDDDIVSYARPFVGILPCLTTFHISASPKWRKPGQYPLRAAFDNLQLPALRTLSLQSRAGTWYNAAALVDVHAAITSAPAITKLVLGTLFLGSDMHLNLAQSGNGITPLAEVAPRLEHLNFEMLRPLAERDVLFVDMVFGSNRWIDLQSPASIIREVTFVSMASDALIDVVTEGAYRSLLISEVREFVKDNVIIGFEEEGPVEVQRAVWGW
jgi:hypothetical protein